MLTKFQAGFIEKDLRSALVNIGADVEIMHKEISMGSSFSNSSGASASAQIEIYKLQGLILEKDAKIAELMTLLNGP